MSDFQAACERGERIDAFLWDGRSERAETAHREALAAMHARGRVDAFLVAKHALGLMYALVQQGNHLAAHGLWVGQSPPEAELWVQCLEAGQIGARDSACYTLLGAYLSSLAADREQARNGMKTWSIQAINWAIEHRDAEICSCALSNWRLQLSEIHGEPVPEGEIREVREVARQAGLSGEFWSGRLWFPRLSPWRVDWTDPGDVTPITPS